METNGQSANIRLSVILPVYNVAPYLHDCLDSLLYGVDGDTEIILVDDGSTDESPAICEAYAAQHAQVRVFHQKNQGQGTARNVGIEVARGTYMTFVDSDDIVSMPAMNHIVERMDATHADLAIADYVSVVPEKKFLKAEIPVAYDEPGCFIGVSDYLKNIGKHNLMVWNKVYRRETMKDIRYPVGVEYEDLNYLHLVMEHTKSILYMPICMYYYRVQRKGNTGSAFKSIRLKGYHFFDEFGNFVRHNFGREEYCSVADYLSGFFQGQYYECAVLLGDKKVMQLIYEKYRHYVHDTPFRLLPLSRSLFRVSPCLYVAIRRFKNKNQR